MSEINGPNFSLNQVNFNSSQKQPIDSLQGIKEDEEPKLKDFSDPKAEAIRQADCHFHHSLQIPVLTSRQVSPDKPR